MAWSYVSASTHGIVCANSASQTISPSANTTAGNRMVCVVIAETQSAGNFPTPSVSDAKNGSWHQDLDLHYTAAVDGSVEELAVFSVQLASALLTTDNITVSFTNTPNDTPASGGIVIAEFSGLSTALNAVDVSASNTTDGTTSWASGTTAATGAANEMVLIAGMDADGLSNTWTTAPTSSSVVYNNMGNTSGDVWVAVKDSGSSGATVSATGTVGPVAANDQNWMGAVVVYKLAGGAGPTNPVVIEFPTGGGVTMGVPTPLIAM